MSSIYSNPWRWINLWREALPQLLDAVGRYPLVVGKRREDPRDQCPVSPDHLLTRDLGKVHGTLIAKDQAMKDFDETYRWVVRSLIQAFRMAGMAELAARVPISPVRRSRKKADAVEQTSTVPAKADTPPIAS